LSRADVAAADPATRTLALAALHTLGGRSWRSIPGLHSVATNAASAVDAGDGPPGLYACPSHLALVDPTPTCAVDPP